MVSGNALGFSPARPAGAGETVAVRCANGFLQPWQQPAGQLGRRADQWWMLVALGRQKKPWGFAWEHQYRGGVLQGNSHLQKAKLPPPVTHHGSCTVAVEGCSQSLTLFLATSPLARNVSSAVTINVLFQVCKHSQPTRTNRPFNNPLSELLDTYTDTHVTLQ